MSRFLLILTFAISQRISEILFHINLLHYSSSLFKFIEIIIS